MEDFCLIHGVCCETCLRPFATALEHVKFKSESGRNYCCEAHMHMHVEYLRLSEEAKEKAKKFPKREIDMSYAHAFWLEARARHP